jgi:CRISPR/Cas system CSM-associated protein Csm4 (group 5 of RAMP superfamily)
LEREATGEYKITKKVGSYDGHFTNRFRIRVGQKKKRRGNLLQAGLVYFSEKRGLWFVKKCRERN